MRRERFWGKRPNVWAAGGPVFCQFGSVSRSCPGVGFRSGRVSCRGLLVVNRSYDVAGVLIVSRSCIPIVCPDRVSWSCPGHVVWFVSRAVHRSHSVSVPFLSRSLPRSCDMSRSCRGRHLGRIRSGGQGRIPVGASLAFGQCTVRVLVGVPVVFRGRVPLL